MTRPSNATATNTAATMREWAINPTFTGAGAAVPVLIRGVGLATTTPISRQGVGLYTLFFRDTGAIVGAFRGLIHTAAAVPPMECKLVPTTFVRSVGPGGSIVQGQLQFEVWNLSATGAVLADPPAGSLVDLQVTFYDNIVSP